jgi:hypothetical protein
MYQTHVLESIIYGMFMKRFFGFSHLQKAGQPAVPQAWPAYKKNSRSGTRPVGSAAEYDNCHIC